MAVEIEWVDSISPAATGNKIYRDTVPSTGEVELADIANGVQFYSDATPDPGTEYKYEVQAHDGAGDETTQEVEGDNMDYITTDSGLGPELIKNGDFTLGNNGDWTLSGTWAIANDRASCVAESGKIRQQDVVGFVAGNYRISFEILTSDDGNVQVRINDSTYSEQFNTLGVHTFDYVAGAGSGWFDIDGVSTWTGSLTNVSCKLIL